MNHKTTMRSAYERINARDLPGFGALLAEDFVEHEELPGIPPTKEGVLAYFQMLLAAFPDMKMHVEDVIDGGDEAVARVKISATHAGDFMGVAPTGKKVAMNLIDIMKFDASGRVTEHWGVADMLTLLQQIGAVPSGPPSAAS